MKLIIHYGTGSVQPRDDGRPLFTLTLRGELDDAAHLNDAELREQLARLKEDIKRRLQGACSLEPRP
jgi:hypothetical protein